MKAVTPHLNKLEGVQGWKVDTDNPEKLLEVKASGTDAQAVRQTVEKAGFKAEEV